MEPHCYPLVVLTDEEGTALARRGFTVTDNVIGIGGFSIIYKGDYFGISIAVKSIDMARLNINMAAVMMEMLILKKVRHHYVVRVYDFFHIETKDLLIFMEYMPGGDLRNLMQDGPLTEGKVVELYWQFGGALAYMHRRGFAHRDLKPDNILLNEEQTVAKLADFGLSTQGYDTYTGRPIKTFNVVGSSLYKAPEVVCSIIELTKMNIEPAQYCPFTTDIWSMGIIVYELLHGDFCYPFEFPKGCSMVDGFNIMMQVTDNLSLDSFDPQRDLSESVKLFIMRHLKWDPEERPTMDELLKDNWIKGLNMTSIASPYPPAVLSDEERTALARRGFTVADDVIAVGAFGIVYRGEYFSTNIAVKKIDLHRNCYMAGVIMEMFILKKIRHHYVVRVYDFFLAATKHLFIFMELLSGGHLGHLMQDNPLTEGKVAELYWQFGGGLAFMHRRGFAHRDLKPENILLTEDKTGAKLADFGLSMQGYDTETGRSIKAVDIVGSAYYISPEVLLPTLQRNFMPNMWLSSYCPFLADIWSMGIIVYEMLYGRNHYPFKFSENSNMMERYVKVKTMATKLSLESFDPQRDLSELVKLFVMRHLKMNPEERPTMDVLLKDNWIQAQITEGSSESELEFVEFHFI